MRPIDAILAALDEREIAQNVRRHDEARIHFPFRQVTVPSNQYFHLISDYAYFHFQYATGMNNNPRPLGSLAPNDQLKFTVMAEEHLRRHAGSRSNEDNFLQGCARDATTGGNGGAKRVLDIIAQGFRETAVENHIFYVFEKHVVYERDRTEIIRQLFQVCDPAFASLFDTRCPDVYSGDYKKIILSYIEWKRTSRDILRGQNPG